MGTDKSAIYEIRNKVNNKIYIGSASFVYSRWGRHRKRLRENKHHNQHLQNAWNKYGEENFLFKIIELVVNKKDLIKKEQLWFETTQCYDRKFGYNIAKVAGSTLGLKTNLGRKRPQEEIDRVANKRARDWLLTDPEGQKYRVHNLTKFCKENNLQQSCMSAVGNNKRPHYKGWLCKKLSSEKDGLGRKLTDKQKKSMSGRKMPKTVIEAIRRSKLKKWLVVTPDQTEIIVEDMIKFCKEYNLNPLSMRRVGRGERKTYKGYKCKLLG